MIRSYKVMLHPNNKQETVFRLYAKASRFAYNWALGREKKQHENGLPFLSDRDLRKEFTKLKKDPKYAWLNETDCDVAKQAIKDAADAYRKFFKGLSGFPRFKNAYRTKPSFYQDPVKLKISERHVKLVLTTGKGKGTSRRARIFNRVKLAEKDRIPADARYMNPRVSFDGLHWWISVSVETKPVPLSVPKTDGIGIDLGVKSLAACSDGTVISNVNKEEKLKILETRRKRLQRSIARKYEKNKKGGRYRKTKNIIKSERQLLELSERIRHIQDDHMKKNAMMILFRNPAFIGIEDLNVKGMVRNHKLARSIQNEKFRIFRTFLENAAEKREIPVVPVSRWYPSSKTCSGCGYVKKDLELGERVYACPACGLKIDRDLNAAINIKGYAEKELKRA